MTLPVAIADLLKLGVRMIGAYDNGAMIASGDDYKRAFTNSEAEILSLYMGRGDSQGRARGTQIQRFRYYPHEAGFVVLDIDRKNSKDGIAELGQLIRGAGLPLPGILSDIPGGSHPCYVDTPSGGVHIYFKIFNGETYKKSQLGKSGAIELFCAGQTLTAPGSQKDGKEYTLHGSFADAPPFLPVLARLIHVKKQPGRVIETYTQSQISLDNIAKWAEKRTSGRHDLCLHIVGAAYRTGYSAGDVRAFVECYTGTAGHDQIGSTIDSIYGGKN